MDPRKNLARLLQAWEEVQADDTWQLCIVGGGNRQIFRAVDVGSSQSNKSVLFLGRQSDAVLSLLYSHATATICSSLYEGFGLPPLEAINHGCRHILVSDIPVFHEILGADAVYFNATDTRAMAESIHALVRGYHTPLSEPRSAAIRAPGRRREGARRARRASR